MYHYILTQNRMASLQNDGQTDKIQLATHYLSYILRICQMMPVPVIDFLPAFFELKKISEMTNHYVVLAVLEKVNVD